MKFFDGGLKCEIKVLLRKQYSLSPIWSITTSDCRLVVVTAQHLVLLLFRVVETEGKKRRCILFPKCWMHFIKA